MPSRVFFNLYTPVRCGEMGKPQPLRYGIGKICDALILLGILMCHDGRTDKQVRFDVCYL